MTPEEARALLDGTTPGPWFFDDDMAGRMHKIGPIVPAGTELECTTDDAALAAHAPDMAAMIAGMREEWGVAVTYPGLSEVVEWGFGTRDGAEAEGESLDTEYRIVRRYVTEPEVIE